MLWGKKSSHQFYCVTSIMRKHSHRRIGAEGRIAWPYLLSICGFSAAALAGVGSAGRERLGLPAWGAIVLLLTCVVCRSINLHVCWMGGGRERLARYPRDLQKALLRWRSPFFEKTAVLVSVGGALVPVCFSLYALTRVPVNLIQLLSIVLLVLVLKHLMLRSKMRRQIAIPFVLLAPAASVLVSLVFGSEQVGVLAYVGGLAGILASADLIHLGDIRNVGRSEAVIGGRESFDAVFVNQLFALLLS